jgi:large repetitive protein
VFIVLIAGTFEVAGQCMPCNNNVPTYYVDLTDSSNATATVVSVRNGSCCGISPPDRCIRFFISVHPNATEVAFTVANPAPPGGAGYMVDCGPLTSLATPFCLTNGDTAFCIVFCKSGNDAATYTFTAYDLSFNASDDITLTAGCTGEMSVTNLQEPSLVWNSIYPGIPGSYNSWLSCTTGCDTTYVTPPTGIVLPPYIDYIVTGNGYGCFFGLQQDTVRVYLIPQVTVNLTAPPFVVCYDSSQVITASAANGIPPYNYIWNTGETTQSITITTGGTYTVTVTDEAGCTGSSASVTYPGEPPMNLNAWANDNLICDGEQLQLNAQFIDSATYTWSGVNGFTSQLQNPVINNFSAQNAGVYSVFASIGSCNSDTLFVNVVHQPLGMVTVANQNICLGNSTTLTASSNISEGTFLWTPGNLTGNQITVSPNTTTNYSVTQTINGCVNNPASATVDVYSPTLAVNVTAASNSICAGTTTTLTANVSGGIAPFTYLWSNGATTQSIVVPPGQYAVTVTDNNGVNCPAETDTITVNEIPLPAMPVISGNSVLCEGETLYLTADNIQGATYYWSGPAGFTSNLQNPSVRNINSGQSGIYTAVIMVNGCTGDTATINVTTKPLPQINTGNHSICYGDTIGLTINSNLTGGSVHWMPGNIIADTLFVSPNSTTSYSAYKEVNGCISNTANSQVFVTQVILSVDDATVCYGASATLNVSGAANYQWSNGLTGNSITIAPPDTMTLTVTGFINNCSATEDATVFVIPQVMLTTGSQPSSCFNSCDGSANIMVTGKTPPYQYLWNTTPVQTTASVIDLCPGDYTVVVTDVNNCYNTASVRITEPDSVMIVTIDNLQICIGEAATITATALGGNGIYDYNWSNGSTGNSITVSPVVTNNYTLTVTDQNGCESSPATVTVAVRDSLKLTASPVQNICAGDSVILSANASGGDGNYYFLWSPGDCQQKQFAVSPASSTEYTVTVKDGCTTPAVSTNVTVKVLPIPVPDFTANVNEACAPVCIDFTDNSIINGSGATYSWSTDNISVTSHSSTFKFCYDYAGFYNVGLIVTDSAGCTNKIVKPQLIKINPVPTAEFYTNPSGTTTNPEIMFINASQGASLFHWNFGDGYEETNSYLNTYHFYADTGNYCTQLTAINDFGCTAKTEECIRVLAALQVFIPNAFTPDGHNNIFNFQGMGIDPDGFVLNIFNRWGEMMFQTFDPQRGWNGRKKDGTKAPTDVYVYKFIIKDNLGKINEFTGYVTVLY